MNINKRKWKKGSGREERKGKRDKREYFLWNIRGIPVTFEVYGEYDKDHRGCFLSTSKVGWRYTSLRKSILQRIHSTNVFHVSESDFKLVIRPLSLLRIIVSYISLLVATRLKIVVTWENFQFLTYRKVWTCRILIATGGTKRPLLKFCEPGQFSMSGGQTRLTHSRMKYGDYPESRCIYVIHATYIEKSPRSMKRITSSLCNSNAFWYILNPI